MRCMRLGHEVTLCSGPMASREPRIAYLVKRVERGVRLLLDEILSELGVTTPEYTALYLLRDREGLSSAQLSRRVYVTPQAMNLIVIELERRSLVKSRPSETNGRVMLVSLTKKGTATLDKCERATRHVEDRILVRLSRPEVAGLRK